MVQSRLQRLCAAGFQSVSAPSYVMCRSIKKSVVSSVLWVCHLMWHETCPMKSWGFAFSCHMNTRHMKSCGYAVSCYIKTCHKISGTLAVGSSSVCQAPGAFACGLGGRMGGLCPPLRERFKHCFRLSLSVLPTTPLVTQCRHHGRRCHRPLRQWTALGRCYRARPRQT